MRTCLAAASGLKSMDQLPQDWLVGCQLLHMEGYVLYRPHLARQVAQSAKAEGCMVLSSLPSMALQKFCLLFISQALKIRIHKIARL